MRGSNPPPATLDLRTLAGARAYEKGESLYRVGAVRSFAEKGRTLRAVVEGASGARYDVRVATGPGGLRSECPCGDDRSPLCKHRVAVILRWLLGERPERRPRRGRARPHAVSPAVRGRKA